MADIIDLKAAAAGVALESDLERCARELWAQEQAAVVAQLRVLADDVEAGKVTPNRAIVLLINDHDDIFGVTWQHINTDCVIILAALECYKSCIVREMGYGT